MVASPVNADMTTLWTETYDKVIENAQQSIRDKKIEHVTLEELFAR